MNANQHARTMRRVRDSLQLAHKWLNSLRNTNAPCKRLRHAAEGLMHETDQILLAIEETLP